MTATVEPPDTAARPLTVEERDLAAENMPLVGWFLSLPLAKQPVAILGREEAFSIASLAFVQAIPRWDPTRGELSTYTQWPVIGALTHAAKMALRRRTQSLGDVQTDGLVAPEERPCVGWDVDAILGDLSDEDKKLLMRVFVEDHTQTALAKELGYTKEGLNARVQRLRRPGQTHHQIPCEIRTYVATHRCQSRFSRRKSLGNNNFVVRSPCVGRLTGR